MDDDLRAQLAEARSMYLDLAESLQLGEASDGHHTHNELYRYRLLYNAMAAQGLRAMGYEVVKSRRHSDGGLCFGSEDWFVVTVRLPEGQLTNHYRMDCWGMFDVPQVPRAPEWDGHDPAEGLRRMEASLPRLAEKAGETLADVHELARLEAGGVDNREGYKLAGED